ncbi:hypothetical protein C471_03338 [Halorubrum saccharovorum DSM 1137]|uniref:DUF7344 domain-containing protein n=1 Tax=Halorubrum saccharovorum DSM 1137 TaxID=1227484 RepID=M0E7W1_9EURY|nr:hypothetical protein [Halorubrum saccharovorum]ELZ42459.1 hypothetical protein C471_03338 [Halorubrum saccharovorum DSM 1137]
MSTTHDTPSERTETVSTPERRRVIAGLADGTVGTVADLQVRGRADEIAAELRETHLPALEEAGYIEWDREEETIEPGPNFDEVAEHLADLPNPDGEPADD